jgi:amino acid transporter
VAVADALGGNIAGTLVAVGTSVSALGIAFAMLVMTPRYLAALGRPEALGTRLGFEDARRVPRRALAITAGLVGVLVFVALGSGAGEGLRRLFLLSSVMVLAQYAVSIAALASMALRGRVALGPRHTWIVPFAAMPLIRIAHAITLSELGVTAGVLAIGVVALQVHRAWCNYRKPRNSRAR